MINQHYTDNSQTLIDIIDNNAQETNLALSSRISFGKKEMTFVELDKLSNKLANYMQAEINIKKGSVVTIMMPNIIQYPIAMLASLKLGAAVVNTNPLYTSRELKNQLIDSGSETIIIASNFIKALEQIIQETKVKNIIITDIGDCFNFPTNLAINSYIKYVKKAIPKHNIKNTINLNYILKEYRGIKYNRAKIKEDDVAFIQYTGGTTGDAKGAVLTHKNIISNIQQCESVCSKIIKKGEEVVLTALPLYHIFALTVNFLLFYKQKSLNVLIANPRDTKFLVNEIKKQKPSFITGVNTLFQSIINTANKKRLKFEQIKASIGGGMSVSKSVSEDWEKITGKPIIEGYGLTECSPLVACNDLENQKFNGSIGKKMPDTEIRIVDEDYKELPVNQTGELIIKGPQVMSHYWNRKQETKEAFYHEWLKTGDICYQDEDGYIYLVDRKKDMINVSGFNVFPKEIESILNSYSKIEESAVIGVDDKKSGESIKAFIKTTGENISKKEISTFCRKHLTSYKVPKHIEFIEDIPKSNVGKILKKDLKLINKVENEPN